MVSLLDIAFDANKINLNDKLDLNPEIVTLKDIATDTYIKQVVANLPKAPVKIIKTASDLTLDHLPLRLFFTNLKVQREQLARAVADKSGVHYDHDLVQVLSVHRYTCQITGEVKVTIWDGMHTVLATYVSLIEGWIDHTGDPLDYEMACQIKDFDMVDFEKGEAEAINKFVKLHQSRTKMAPFYMLRANACRAMLGASDLQATQALELFNLFFELGVKMVPGKSKAPLTTSHISGIQKVSDYGSDSFNMNYIESSLNFIKKYCSNEKGIDSTFLMMMSILYKKIDHSPYTIYFDETTFAKFVKSQGGMKGIAKLGTGLYSKFVRDNERAQTDRDYFGLCFVIHAYVKKYVVATNGYPSFGGDWKALGLEA